MEDTVFVLLMCDAEGEQKQTNRPVMVFWTQDEAKATAQAMMDLTPADADEDEDDGQICWGDDPTRDAIDADHKGMFLEIRRKQIGQLPPLWRW